MRLFSALFVSPPDQSLNTYRAAALSSTSRTGISRLGTCELAFSRALSDNTLSVPLPPGTPWKSSHSQKTNNMDCHIERAKFALLATHADDDIMAASVVAALVGEFAKACLQRVGAGAGDFTITKYLTELLVIAEEHRVVRMRTKAAKTRKRAVELCEALVTALSFPPGGRATAVGEFLVAHTHVYARLDLTLRACGEKLTRPAAKADRIGFYNTLEALCDALNRESSNYTPEVARPATQAAKAALGKVSGALIPGKKTLAQGLASLLAEAKQTVDKDVVDDVGDVDEESDDDTGTSVRESGGARLARAPETGAGGPVAGEGGLLGGAAPLTDRRATL